MEEAKIIADAINNVGGGIAVLIIIHAFVTLISG